MIRTNVASMFSLSLGLVFASLNISYSNQNSCYNKASEIMVNHGRESFKLRENWGDRGKEAGEGKGGGGIGLPIDLIWQLLKVYKGFFILLWARIKGVLGLPF